MSLSFDLLFLLYSRVLKPWGLFAPAVLFRGKASSVCDWAVPWKVGVRTKFVPVGAPTVFLSFATCAIGDVTGTYGK